MSRAWLFLGLGVLAAGWAVAQAPSPTLAAGTKVNAELKSKLDTRHAKVGDKVTAVTTSDLKEHGEKVLPKGSTLTGHVTEVTRAESSKSPSRIGVLFDQAVTKKGQVIPLHAGIASVLTGSAAAMEPTPPMQPMAMPSPPMMAGGGASGGGLLGGAAGGVGATAGAVMGAGAEAGPVLGSGAGMASGELGAPGMLNGGASAVALGRASNGVPVEIAMPSPDAQAGQQAGFGSVLSTPRVSGWRSTVYANGGGCEMLV